MNQQTDILQGLNEQQAEAVLLNEGPFLVLAGAGSGKTRVLTHRIVHLIVEKQADPASILGVTFTNKAAREMKTRLEKLIPPNSSNRLWIGTFHGICNRLLRTEIHRLNLGGLKWTKNFVIFDTTESLSILKETLKVLNLDEKVYTPKAIQSKISALKNQALGPIEFSKKITDNFELKLSEIYDKYQEKLNFNNALDFDDLLLFSLKLFEGDSECRKYYHERFKHILVDEFQDTNQTQYDLLKMLLTHPDNSVQNWQARSFCAVGDIDQSIYSWRGANYRLTLNLQKDFPSTQLIKLEYNYRSVDPILEVANSVISNNKQRIDKKLLGTKGSGEKITCFEASDEVEEANFITAEIKRLKSKNQNLNEIAVLYRTNSQSRAIEEALIKGQIAYKLVGGVRFYDRLEIKDIVSYLRLIFNSKDSNALKRVINSPRRGIGPSTIAQVEEKAETMGSSLYSALADLLDEGGLGPRVIASIHSFVEVIDYLIKQSDIVPVPDLVRLVLEKTGYLIALQDSDKEEAEGRLENIYELLNVAQQFHEESEDKTLGAFLAQIALASDLDNLKDSDSEAVTLLTIHSSKGLEYPFVFLTGLEEGIFPNSRALGDSPNSTDDLEEERRLLYVAITRAEKKLFLTYARNRRLWGKKEYSEPSRFLKEMPETHLTGFWGSSVKSPSGKGLPPVKNSSESSFYSKREAEAKENKKNAAPQEPKIKVGDRVQHKSFGLGRVLSLFGSKNI